MSPLYTFEILHSNLNSSHRKTILGSEEIVVALLVGVGGRVGCCRGLFQPLYANEADFCIVNTAHLHSPTAPHFIHKVIFIVKEVMLLLTLQITDFVLGTVLVGQSTEKNKKKNPKALSERFY